MFARGSAASSSWVQVLRRSGSTSTQVAQDEFPLFRALAIGVGLPVLDAAEEYFGGGTQQDDGVETIVEAALVRNRPRDVQGRPVVTREELRHPVLPPYVPAFSVRPFAPAAHVGIDHAEAQPSKFRERAGLPGSRHSSHEDLSHRGQR